MSPENCGVFPAPKRVDIGSKRMLKDIPFISRARSMFAGNNRADKTLYQPQAKKQAHTQTKTVVFSNRDLCHPMGIARFIEP